MTAKTNAVGKRYSQVNAIGLVRLSLVLAVVLSHSYSLGSYGPSPLYAGLTSGEWALAGLFAVSGFLVTRGRQFVSWAGFMKRRVMRLYPAFVVCLLVIAFVLAPVGYVLQTGGLDSYLSTPGGPFSFISLNALLEVRQYTISGTPASEGAGWAGNLWTIFYTVLCYAALAFALSAPDPRKRLVLVSVAFILTVALHGFMPSLLPYLQDPRFGPLLRFLPYFLGGAVIALIRDRIAFTGWVAVPLMAATVGFAAVFPTIATQVMAPAICYSLVWVATVLPPTPLLRRWDVSMGLFMYSFAIQRLLVALGVAEALPSPWLFFAVSVLATFPFAILSWWLVESRFSGVAAQSRTFAKRPAGSLV